MSTVAELANVISASEPRYSIYSVPDAGKIAFFYTCPNGLGVRERMLYASSKQCFLNALASSYGMSIAVKVMPALSIHLLISSMKSQTRPSSSKSWRKVGLSRTPRLHSPDQNVLVGADPRIVLRRQLRRSWFRATRVSWNNEKYRKQAALTARDAPQTSCGQQHQ